MKVNNEAVCDFCLKASTLTETLVQGKDDVHICRECAELVVDIFEAGDDEKRG